MAPAITIAGPTRYDLADPFLFDAGGHYDLFVSTSFGDPGAGNVPVLVGEPGHWRQPADALPQVPGWASPARAGVPLWAPAVYRLQGTDVLYVAAPVRGASPPTHCIAVATAADPDGPFVPRAGPPLVCQASLGGDIDPEVVTDPAGPDGPQRPEYLIWKSDNNNLPGSGPATIWAAPLANDGLSLSGPPTAIFRPQAAWEQPIVEAPSMVRAPDGSLWLFFSAGTGFAGSHYGIGLARCASVLGPCQDASTQPFLASNAQGPGPGEESVFQAADGSTWLLYDPWHTGVRLDPFRPVDAVRLGWGRNGPYVAQARSFPPPAPARARQR